MKGDGKAVLKVVSLEPLMAVRLVRIGVASLVFVQAVLMVAVLVV